jgi:hypothetical protein
MAADGAAAAPWAGKILRNPKLIDERRRAGECLFKHCRQSIISTCNCPLLDRECAVGHGMHYTASGKWVEGRGHDDDEEEEDENNLLYFLWTSFLPLPSGRKLSEVFTDKRDLRFFVQFIRATKH